MTRWNDLFQSHAFRTTWNALKTALADEELIADENETAYQEVARLNKVINYVDAILDQVDPELMPVSHLDSLNQQASSCLQNLTAFKGNQNIGHLQNANTHIDATISLISQTPFALLGQQKGALTKSVTAYSETLEQYIGKLKEFIDTTIETEKVNLTELQKSISSNSTELSQLKEQLKVVEQTIQKQTAEFNTQFQASESARAVKFESAVTKLDDKVDSEFTSLATKVGTALNVLDRYQADAAKVLGVVVNTSQAGAYFTYANQEKQSADFLRRSAIILMIIGVAVLVVPEIAKIFKDVAGYQLDWRMALGRIPFSLILFVPAFYLARESTKHRNTEILNRRRELILSTIDPYLALLDSKKAEQIKVDIAKGIFSEGPPSNETTSDDAGNLIAQITNLAKQLMSKSS